MADKESKYINDKEKFEKSEVKYRKIIDGPVKKTGLEQLEQMKNKKREKNLSIQEVSDNINKNITVFKNKVDNSSQNGKKNIDSEYIVRNSPIDRKAMSNLNTKNEEKIEKKVNDKNSNSQVDNKGKNKGEINKNLNKEKLDKSISNKKENVEKKQSKYQEYDEKKEVTDISNKDKIRKEIKKKNSKRKRYEKYSELKEKVKKINYKRVIAIACIMVFVIGFSVAFSMTMIQNTIIDEGSNYTEEEVKNIVMNNVLDYNSVYLFLKYRYTEREKVPFVEYIDVSWVNKSTVKIKVYDKSIIGCTNYMNEYIYFDKDGIVLETSAKKQKNIQYITGLNFSEVKLNDKIVVKDEEIFDTILSVTQQISKYKLDINEINFDQRDNLTLYADNITVLLGNKETYDEQLAKLKNMLEEAKKENLKGIFHMENYEEGQNRIIFNKID